MQGLCFRLLLRALCLSLWFASESNSVSDVSVVTNQNLVELSWTNGPIYSQTGTTYTIKIIKQIDGSVVLSKSYDDGLVALSSYSMSRDMFSDGFLYDVRVGGCTSGGWCTYGTSVYKQEATTSTCLATPLACTYESQDEYLCESEANNFYNLAICTRGQLYHDSQDLLIAGVANGCCNFKDVAYTTTGRLKRAASGDPSVRVWNFNTRKLVSQLTPGTDYVFALRYCTSNGSVCANYPNASQLVTRADDLLYTCCPNYEPIFSLSTAAYVILALVILTLLLFAICVVVLLIRHISTMPPEEAMKERKSGEKKEQRNNNVNDDETSLGTSLSTKLIAIKAEREEAAMNHTTGGKHKPHRVEILEVHRQDNEIESPWTHHNMPANKPYPIPTALLRPPTEHQSSSSMEDAEREDEERKQLARETLKAEEKQKRKEERRRRRDEQKRELEQQQMDQPVIVVEQNLNAEDTSKAPFDWGEQRMN